MMYFFRKKVRQKSSTSFNLKGVSKNSLSITLFFSLYDKLKKVLPEKRLPPKRCCLCWVSNPVPSAVCKTFI